MISAPDRIAKDLSPPEKDRWMQIWLAQARGRVRNGEMLREAIDRALVTRAANNGTLGVYRMDDALIETLTVVADALDGMRVPYAVTGSVASSVHGLTTSTYDADLIVLASPKHAAALSEKLQPRFYAPQDMLLEAVRNHSFVNVVDNRTSYKVDFSFIGDDPFLVEALRRRVQRAFGKHQKEFWFVTPEDIILMKLLWRKDTRSTKQWDNALTVARYQGTRMDWKYLFEQARALRVEPDLIKLRDEAGI
jgi:hypothetical protein